MPAPPLEDYYALLGVQPGVDGDGLRRAWRVVALQWHPDRAGDAATAKFQRLSQAYAVLSDPVARAAYDRRRRAAEPAVVGPPKPAATPDTASRPTRRAAPGVALQRLSGPLASLLACGAARREQPGVITLVMREAEAAQGGIVTISMPVDLWCPACEGQEQSAQCERCGGQRTVRELFAAWLSVPPGVQNDELLAPSVELPGMVTPVRFRVRLAAPR